MPTMNESDDIGDGIRPPEEEWELFDDVVENLTGYEGWTACFFCSKPDCHNECVVTGDTEA